MVNCRIFFIYRCNADIIKHFLATVAKYYVLFFNRIWYKV